MPQEQTSLNRKDLYKEIVNLGFPSFIETLFITFTSVIDSKMVSALGVGAISAVSVTNQPRLFIFSIFFALYTVTSSLVAKYYGKQDRDAANMVLDHVLKLVVILSIVLGFLSVVLAKPLMLLFSGQPDTMADSVVYFRIVMGGMIFNHVFVAINSALRGFGKTRMTLISNVISSAVNLFCNYLLITGHWGFPAWGIAGAAVATVLGTVAACITCICFMLNEELYVNLPYCAKHKHHISPESLREIAGLTKSCATDNIAMRATLLAISSITARIGSFYMSIYAIGNYLLNVNFALGTGLQTSAVALVGKSYGAEDKEKINQYKNALMRIGFISAVIVGALIIISGKAFFGFFSDDPKFISVGARSCLLIGAVTIPQTLKFVLNGCMQGVGAMREVMIASILAFSVVNLGMVAFTILVLHMNIYGVWISSLLSQTSQTLMLYYFMRHNEAFSGGK